MKTAIIYSTHHGTTETVAKHMQDQLYPQKVELINLATNKLPDTNNYDIVILGSSIHAGRNQRNMQNFCKRNLPELLQKDIGLFLCCMNEGQNEQNIQNAYPEILRKHAFCVQIMGGEFKMDRMNFIEKLLTSKIVGVTMSQSKLNYPGIDRFVSRIKGLKSVQQV